MAQKYLSPTSVYVYTHRHTHGRSGHLKLYLFSKKTIIIQNQANYNDVTTQLYRGSFVVVVVVNIDVVVIFVVVIVVVVVVNVVVEALLVVTDHIIFNCGQ